jgi:hypothetical protein
MGYIQERMESDRKISEAFQAVTNDELTADVIKANDYIRRMREERVESFCPLCGGTPSVKIRICEDHQIELTNNLGLISDISLLSKDLAN